MTGDGESVVQVEIVLRYGDGRIADNADRPVNVSVENGTLLSLDSGTPADHTLYASPIRNTFHGRALAILRGVKGPAPVRIRVSAEGLEAAEVIIPAVQEAES